VDQRHPNVTRMKQAAQMTLYFKTCVSSVAAGLVVFGQCAPAFAQAADSSMFVASFETAADYARAHMCLTEAVYYEAALEPDAGQEAVANVILNRVRHPAYPKSVCGVVYQGSTRRTGCQFSYTCDGSLARKPVAHLWAKAEAVATRALSGCMWPGVGDATHYHANYVSPYWRSSLLTVAHIGAHIFYAIPNSKLGQSSSLIAEPEATARSKPETVRRSPAPATFRGWGLPVATITLHQGDIQIRSSTKSR
jgi:Cell Wall Hydrolase